MRRNERGEPLSTHLFQQFGKNAIGCGDIQIAGRFIGQQQTRLIGERPGNGNPLLLTA